MRALCWYGKEDVRVETVPDPTILNPQDAILRITATAICGSDLHLYAHVIPTMQAGDILGHEFMGEVVEVGSAVTKLKKGDRVVVPFTIACGRCFHCERAEQSLCDNSNPNAELAAASYGYSGAGLFGFSHMLGGYAGGQAQYVRVPFADVGPIKVPDGIPDDKVLFLSDIFPTGWQAAFNCGIEPGNVVAVWGCGPVGLFTIKSLFLQGAARVIAIDRHTRRLELAKEAGAEIINYEDEDSVQGALREMTAGRGPDACVDAVGMEAHGFGVLARMDQIKMGLKLATDRPTVLREAIQACRKGGTVSIPGVYGGMLDKVNLGAAFGKGLTFKMGQTHVQRYLPELLNLVVEGKIDPSFLITHRAGLSEAPEMYRQFREERDEYVKVVLDPAA